MIEKIIPAQLHWGEDGLPRSTEFGDLYFSAEGGLDETRHVFLQGNDLATRWASLKAGDLFVIAETGFGSGLNLLAAAQLWKETAHPKAKLQFVSIEQYPMQLEDMTRTVQHWQELRDLGDQLAANYPVLTPGFHRFDLLPNLEVTLVFDDIESGLRSICPPLEPSLWETQPYAVDAWFLDGFAPSKNPQMWQPNLFPLIHRLSKPGTTAATFTAVGDVRRALQHWGFTVTKQPGFGRKREMLTAKFEVADTATKPDLSQIAPKHKNPISCWTLSEPAVKKTEQPIAIIGAGIAGATLASALAKRGRQVHVFDAGSGPAEGASGIPQVALYARLSPDVGDLEDFMLSAMPYSQAYYRQLIENDPDQSLGTLAGLVQLPRDERERKKMARISERLQYCKDFVRFLDAENLSAAAGIALESPGLFFPQSGWMNGPAVCAKLLQQDGIQTYYDSELKRLDHTDDGWQLEFSNGQHRDYQQVVLCNGMKASSFKQLSWLPTKAIRGQISLLPAQASLDELKTVICRETQLNPRVEGTHSIGSTYGLDDSATDIRAQDHAQNLKKLNSMIGESIAADLETIQGKAAIRCTTPDYIPIVGPVPEYEAFLRRFARFSKDARSKIPQPGPVETGLFVNLGYGSRGFSYAPLCAEQLASQICGEMPPLPDYLVRSMHPARFLVRGLVRGKLSPAITSS